MWLPRWMVWWQAVFVTANIPVDRAAGCPHRAAANTPVVMPSSASLELFLEWDTPRPPVSPAPGLSEPLDSPGSELALFCPPSLGSWS